MTVLYQNRYASNAYAFCHCFASSAHAEKMQALFRLCLLSFRACRGISWKGTISKPARGRSKAYPPSSRSFPRFRSPYCNATRNPRKAQLGGDTLGLAVQELSLIVSLVFGAAHCAMQNSRKLRTACNCSTLYNTPPVYLGNPQKASLLWEEEQPNISYRTRKSLCGLNM